MKIDIFLALEQIKSKLPTFEVRRDLLDKASTIIGNEEYLFFAPQESSTILLLGPTNSPRLFSLDSYANFSMPTITPHLIHYRVLIELIGTEYEHKTLTDFLNIYGPATYYET